MTALIGVGALRALTIVMLLTPTTLSAAAVDQATQSITIALTQEPPNLNTLATTDLVSFFVIGHVQEGLLRYDARGRLVGGVAEGWEQTDEELRFTLREGARWSDGKPVTAQDFLFAFRKIVDPASAAPYAAIHYPILNAEAIHKGRKAPAELGVFADDERTLRIALEAPCGYCPKLMTHAAFFPIREDFYTADASTYGAEPERLLYNGPFRLTAWKHDAELTMERNDAYWDARSIRLNRIHVGYITSDNRTRLNLFRENSIALVRLDSETMREAAAARLKVQTFVSGGLAFLRFNFATGATTANVHFRRALQQVFDPDEFVNKVIAVPGYKPARSLFPSWLDGVERKFQAEYPASTIAPDPARARELMAVARASGLPDRPLVLLTVASPTGLKISEYLQGLIRTHLGVEVAIDRQTFKQYLAKARQGDFDLLLSSWYPDFDDVMTYADLLASWNPNNRGGYASGEYDSWLKLVQSSADQGMRMKAAAELQKLIARDVAVLPMAETGSAYVQHRQLKGVVRRVLGADPDYTYARVTR